MYHQNVPWLARDFLGTSVQEKHVGILSHATEVRAMLPQFAGPIFFFVFVGS